MLEYPIEAITVKTINKFTYNMYLDIYANMLKYQNDSSATLRMLSSFIDTSQDVLEDFLYKPRFNFTDLDFTTIDRFNGFVLDKIPLVNLNRNENTIYCNSIYGFSKYTGETYELEYVKNNADFVRHSYPCDCFFGEEISSNGLELISLPPNFETNIDIKVLNSVITITPYSGFSKTNLIDSSITIRLKGIDMTGREVEEDIEINILKDYKSNYEYAFITSCIAIGSTAAVQIVIYPYLKGEFERWDNEIIDRETFEQYDSMITIDRLNKNLLFHIIRDNKTNYPIPFEPFKVIEFNIPLEETIWQHYIDTSNKLVYLITSAKKLYCFPLIIPTKYNNTLDDIKTEYQSIRVEYYEDSVDKQFTFYIFPSHKTNDIETMSIFINNQEYESDMLLDLYRENIETNRIIIPYDTLFTSTDDALVEFRTYGVAECICPVYLSNPKIDSLYIKDLTNINLFTEAPSGGMFVNSNITNRNIDYKEYITGDFDINYQCSIFKVSSIGNILINGYKIINVFKTFYYDEQSNTILTADTITNLTGAI